MYWYNGRIGRTFTSTWPVVNVDGLGGVVAIIILYGYKVGVGLWAKVGTQGQHMVVAVAQSLCHLSTHAMSGILISSHSQSFVKKIVNKYS